MQPDEPNKRPDLTEEIKGIGKEAAYVGLLFTFLGSEASLAALIVFITNLASPKLGAGGVQAIIDVFISTVPLTIAVAVIVGLWLANVFTNWSLPLIAVVCAGILYGAGVAANALHLGMAPVNFRPPQGTAYHQVAFLLNDYFKTYGGLPFLKSIILGAFFGSWFSRLHARFV